MGNGPMRFWIELFFLNYWRETAVVSVLLVAYATVLRRVIGCEASPGKSGRTAPSTVKIGQRAAMLILLPLVLSATGCGLWYNTPGGGFGGSSGGGTGGGGGNGPGNGGGGSITAPLTVAPASLTWVKEPVGQTAGAKTITVTNPNTAAVTIASIASGNDFVLSGNTCPLSGTTLAAGANCTLSVQFRPQAEGAIAENLSIVSNASTDPQNVALSGNGVAGPLLFTPSALSFPTTDAGQTSPQQTVTLANTTASAITMTAITHTNMFPETNNCTPTLPAGASCTFNVTFAPLCSGSKTGTVTAHAGNDTVLLYLSGTATGTSTCPGPGVPSGNTALSIAPGRLLFGDQPVGSTTTLQLVATNYQTYDINIANISIPAPFSQVNNCPPTLPQGFSCTINVSYVPTAKGYSSELLSITDSGAAVPQTIPVTGNAVPAGSQSIVDKNEASDTGGRY